ncbi:MAG: NAD(P)/FAD-dependent oxidoreductase, partial [Elusimicrobia bacterium]|nr:NAD(P)/FAD-dependent oxidoreductase [Elusimicrobiota bacterium]
MEEYKYIVVGSGPAGYSAALHLAAERKNVSENVPGKVSEKILLIEKDDKNLGGTCLNKGCIPMKSYLKAADIYLNLKKGRDYGIDISFKKPHFKAIFNKSRENINVIKKGLAFMLKQSSVETAFGRAEFLSQNSLKIISAGDNSRKVKGEKFILAPGSIPAVPLSIDIDGKKTVTSDYFFKNNILPESITIAGGGYVGCELASFLNAIGKNITIIEIKNRLMPTEDADTGRFLQKEFKKKGITVLTKTEIASCNPKGASLEIFLKGSEKKGSEKPLSAELLAVTCGRKSSLSGESGESGMSGMSGRSGESGKKLNLEKAGVETENGFIKVGADFRTSNPDIFAAG